MRRLPAELILAAMLGSDPALADPYIDAPMPPYCNPRGNWSECDQSVGTTERFEFSTDELAAIVEFRPFVRERTARIFGVAGGYAKLTLRWFEDQADPSATLALVSHRALSEPIAARLAHRCEKLLDEEAVLLVEIERFEWPWQRDPRSDWCELSRATGDDSWIVECGAE